MAAGFVAESSWCEIVDESGRVSALLLCDFAGSELKAPTDLVTSEVTHRSFRASWTPPGGPVDNYRVTYTPATGGPTQEVRGHSLTPASPFGSSSSPATTPLLS